MQFAGEFKGLTEHNELDKTESSHIGLRKKKLWLNPNVQTSAVCTLTDFVDSFPRKSVRVEGSPKPHFIQSTRAFSAGFQRGR